MKKLFCFFLTTCIVALLHRADAHGRMNQPPARNVMWRYGFSVPPNYDDFGLNCGGVGVQHQSNGGKCGICGDNYADEVKAHEVGGEYATGIVGKTFSKGQVIDVNILLSANHLGYFEFKLCPVYNEKVEVKQECLDKTLLKINGNSYKYNVMAGERSIDLKVKLPEDLTCKHCVMQWRYRAGNNWGEENGQGGLGLGPQEEFWNCADVAILNGPVVPSILPEPTIKPDDPRPEPLTDPAELEQITTPIFMNKNPSPTYDQDEGQIACALRGIEENKTLLYKKIQVCLQQCKKDISDSCPEECFCIWTVNHNQPKDHKHVRHN